MVDLFLDRELLLIFKDVPIFYCKKFEIVNIYIFHIKYFMNSKIIYYIIHMKQLRE